MKIYNSPINNISNKKALNSNDTVVTLKKNAPSFGNLPIKMGRESTMILSSLSKEARIKLGTTIYKEYNGTLSGGAWINAKLTQLGEKFKEALIKNDESGQAEILFGTVDNIIDERSEKLLSNVVLKNYVKQIFNKDGAFFLPVEEFYPSANMIVGKGFRIVNGQSMELAQEHRKPLIDLLETAKTFDEIKKGLQSFKSVCRYDL